MEAPLAPETLTSHLSIEQVAQRWGVTKKSVQVKIRSGDLPAVRLGQKSIRIRLEDIEAYEAAHMYTAPDLDPADLAWIQELVENAPPLTEEQKAVIRSAFRA
jgi:excisionase family DNA binding protein